MNAAEHWQAWLDRYGDDYATDEERRAAYRDFKANLRPIHGNVLSWRRGSRQPIMGGAATAISGREKGQ